MEVPRYWRMNKQRYALAGAVCSTCNTPTFPPRPVCPQCAEAARQRETYVQLETSLPSFVSHAELAVR